LAGSKQDLRPNLHLPSFHRGEIVLVDANAFGELLLRHVKAAHLPDAATTEQKVNEPYAPRDDGHSGW